jgi:zinc-ribbon domain
VVPGSDPFVCPRCGTPAALDSRFCSGCGANLARKRRLRRKSDFDERQEGIDERQAVSELSGRLFAELGFLSGEFAWRDVRRLKPLRRSGEEVLVAVQCDIVGSGWVAQGVVAATESRILFVSKAPEIVFNLSDIDAITRGWRLGRTLTVHSAGERVRMRLCTRLADGGNSRRQSSQGWSGLNKLTMLPN